MYDQTSIDHFVLSLVHLKRNQIHQIEFDLFIKNFTEGDVEYRCENPSEVEERQKCYLQQEIEHLD